MSTYKTGSTSPNVILDVDVDTIGPAATRASKRPTGSGGGGITVGYSVDATGDITKSSLGGASSLIGSTITIATTINLFGGDEEREREYERLQAVYILSGGDEGKKEFEVDLKLHNTDFSIVTLVKNISLI